MRPNIYRNPSTNLVRRYFFYSPRQLHAIVSGIYLAVLLTHGNVCPLATATLARRKTLCYHLRLVRIF